MDKYLKPYQYYSDLYDRHTVDQCRRTEQSFKSNDNDLPPPKDMSKKEAARIKLFAKKWYLHIQTGERYLAKSKTIQEWMDSAKQKDDLLESAQSPEDVRCLTCRSRVTPTFKELWTEMDKPDRVLFMYDCPNNCAPRRSFFSDGTEWRTKPDLCPECDSVLNKKMADDGKKLTTTFTCPNCDYTNQDEYVWTHKEEEKLDEKFAVDRDRFCLTDEEGSKYQDEKYRLEQLGKIVDEHKKKEEALAEKLKANPKGFHLEGAGYRCFICGDSTPEGDNWYDEYGIKCLVCQKAIDEGEIPASLAKAKESWYSKWELDDRFNLKGPTLRKWIKDGIIKARTVSHFGKGVHVELFLIEDNKGFLPPKKLVESKAVKVREKGKDWITTRNWYEFVDPFKHLKGYKIMNYMRVIPPEEMKAREEAEKKKSEEKQKKREERRVLRARFKKGRTRATRT